MDLASIEPALAAIASTITGVPASCVQWENAPRVQWVTALVLLSWVSIVGVGIDGTEWTYGANADPLLEMQPTVVGLRRAVMQLSVQTLRQDAGHTARAIAEVARTRLQSPSTSAALAAAGLAFAGTEGVVKADYTVDKRVISRCLVDVRLNALSRVADPAGATSYIDTIEIAATVTRPDGSTVGAPLSPGGTYP